MRTIHVADARSRAFAEQLIPAFASKPHFERKAFQLEVCATTGADRELVLVAGESSFTSKGNHHFGVVSLAVTRRGVTQKLRVKTRYYSGRKPPLEERRELLATRAAWMLLPYFARTPAARVTKRPAANRTIHVDGYYVQDEPAFRSRIIGRLAALGFRTKLTLGLSDTDPDPACWGYLQIPFLNSYRWKPGKLALSPAHAMARGHEAKTTIRATVEGELPEAKATALLADKLVAWYSKLAAIAES